MSDFCQYSIQTSVRPYVLLEVARLLEAALTERALVRPVHAA